MPVRTHKVLQRIQRVDDRAVQHDALHPAAFALSERTFGGDADLVHPWLFWGRFNSVDQLAHLGFELAARQHHLRVLGDEQEPVVGDVAAGQGRAGQQAEGLNGKG